MYVYPIFCLILQHMQIEMLICCELFIVYVHAGGKVYTDAHFGAGSGPIFLDDVQCTSSSDQLLECPSRPMLSHNCSHSNDAGVGCEGMWSNRIVLNRPVITF